MSIPVRIPTVLRRYTDGQEEVRVEGDNVRQVIENLTSNNEQLHQMLFDDNGEFQYKVANLYVNEEDTRFLQKLDTPLQNGDEVTIIAAAAGGRGVVKTNTTVTVEFAGPLQKLFDSQAEVQAQGETVRDVIEYLKAQNETFGARLAAVDDRLLRYVSFWVNEKDVRFLQGLDTPLRNGDEVLIVPVSVGGAI